MASKKVAICLFNRATHGRMSVLIDKMVANQAFDVTLLFSGSVNWDEFGGRTLQKENGAHVEEIFVPLSDGFANDTRALSYASGSIVSSFGEWFNKNPQDLVIVVGDRYETLPAAMAAKYTNHILVHIQGGEVTGNLDDEIRHAVTKLADYHLTSTPLSKEYVIAMGEDHRRVWSKGCPSLDLIHQNKIKRSRSDHPYFVCMFHPETEDTEQESVSKNEMLLEAVLQYCKRYVAKCIWYIPNPDPGRLAIQNFLNAAIEKHAHHLVKATNQKTTSFLKEFAGADMIIGNSSCGIRESSFIGLPSINLGWRQGYRERGINVLQNNFDLDLLIRQMDTQKDIRKYPVSHMYGSGSASAKIVKILEDLEPTRKGTLTYPYDFRYRERHFGPNRSIIRRTSRVPRVQRELYEQQKKIRAKAEPKAL